jgi:hypothetical protein
MITGFRSKNWYQQSSGHTERLKINDCKKRFKNPLVPTQMIYFHKSFSMFRFYILK